MMLAFDAVYLELARRESRAMHTVDGAGRVEATYLFREHYCVVPGCDCRSVRIAVHWIEGGEIVAHIDYIFEKARARGGCQHLPDRGGPPDGARARAVHDVRGGRREKSVVSRAAARALRDVEARGRRPTAPQSRQRARRDPGGRADSRRRGGPQAAAPQARRRRRDTRAPAPGHGRGAGHEQAPAALRAAAEEGRWAQATRASVGRQRIRNPVRCSPGTARCSRSIGARRASSSICSIASTSIRSSRRPSARGSGSRSAGSLATCSRPVGPRSSSGSTTGTAAATSMRRRRPTRSPRSAA